MSATSLSILLNRFINNRHQLSDWREELVQQENQTLVHYSYWLGQRNWNRIIRSQEILIRNANSHLAFADFLHVSNRNEITEFYQLTDARTNPEDKGLPWLIASELLTYYNPQKYSIYRGKDTLKPLRRALNNGSIARRNTTGDPTFDPPSKHWLILSHLERVLQALRQEIPDANYRLVDIFLSYITSN